MTDNIPAQLKVITEILPFENAEEEANAPRIAGAPVMRSATHFGYSLYPNDQKTTDEYFKGRSHHPFQNGDLVKVFKTVSDGDVLWEGQVSLNRERDQVKGPTGYQGQAVGGFWVHGVQDNMDSHIWGRMFFDRLPARLERDGKVIYGALDPFFETGTEGIIWSVQEFGQYGYAGLNPLKDGDKLTVYSSVRDGDVEWEGPVYFEKADPPVKTDWDQLGQIPQHLDSQTWLRLSYDNRPVLITPDGP